MRSIEMSAELCELCGVEATRLERHHLVPRLAMRRRRKRRKLDPRDAITPCALICHACHRMLHTYLDNGTLDREYDAISKLREHPELARYIDWRKAHPTQGAMPPVRSVRR